MKTAHKQVIKRARAFDTQSRYPMETEHPQNHTRFAMMRYTEHVRTERVQYFGVLNEKKKDVYYM